MSRIPLWIDLRHVPVNKRLSFLHAIDETAAHRVVLAKDDPHHQRQGLKTVWLDGHNAVREGKVVVGKWVKVADAKGVERAAKVEGVAVVECTDWSVIPLESLIAARQDRPGALFAFAKDAAQAALFALTLERGVDGIVIAPASSQAIYDTDAALRAAHTERRAQRDTPAAATLALPRASVEPRVVKARLAREPVLETPSLVAATITAMEDAGPGDRVCIDTTSLFREGEGLLVGSTARSFVLVHAETLESGFIATRPFRVNAGAVHSYLFRPDQKTRYLSELASGQAVQALHHDGTHRQLTIGRVKVERRPHLLVRWRCEDATEGQAALQNAETIRLIAPDGSARSVTQLRVGDQVLVHNEQGARHTGIPIDEAVEER